MKITEVRIFPTESKDGKLKAFATMTFDDWFVVRNVKVIQGNSGLFVAMPSRKAVDSCPKCRFKNVVGSKYCNQCGGELKEQVVAGHDENDKHNSHMDIAHPISQECRIYIQEKILKAYADNAAGKKAAEKQPKADENVSETAVKEPVEPVAVEIQKPAEELQSIGNFEKETIDIGDGKDIEL